MNTLMRSTPATGLTRLQREVDQLFERFLEPLSGEGTNTPSQVWTPVADVSEREDAFEVRVDLPGLSRDDVAVTFDNGQLQISGERRGLRRDEKAQVHRIERWHGRFFRALTFGPNVEPDGIEATFEDGVLTVSVPKREESKPRRIAISGPRALSEAEAA